MRSFSRFLAVILMVGLTGCYAASSGSAESIVWINSYEEALKASEAQGKPVMIDFYADWCGWCRKLDAETYKDKDVITESRNFINLKVNTDNNSRLAGKYVVRGLPTIYFTDAKGNIIGGGPGFRDARRLTAEMRSALQKYGKK